jgi:hypothetical protein
VSRQSLADARSGREAGAKCGECAASRSSFEFGYWTEDADLVGAVARFLVSLIGASEDLDAVADEPDPELARVEFDDEAMAEAAADSYHASVEEAALRGEELDADEW